ncbi:MAG: toprim domain-containing protein, partial [Pseudomonadota bacterium]
MNAKEVSRMLAARAESFARYLFPNGKKIGQEYCVGNINGDQGESLKIHLTGEKSGVWSDFASGEAGDLLDLIALKRNLKIAEAIIEARQWLGMTPHVFEPQRRLNFAKPSGQHMPPLLESSPAMSYLLNERKLSIETVRTFNISEHNNQIAFPYLRDGDLIFIKYLGVSRPNGKKQISVEANCEPCLFGWQTIPPNARVLILCEGELDAMTLYQYGLPALSVPFGGGKGQKQQWVEHEFERLTIFDEIFLCFDPDAEGQLAITELTERLGANRCRIVKLPHKDPNACLQSGVTKEEMRQCFASAANLDPIELKRAHSYVEEVINEFYPGEGHEIGIDPP